MDVAWHSGASRLSLEFGFHGREVHGVHAEPANDWKLQILANSIMM
jgi:hypothetical protein